MTEQQSAVHSHGRTVNRRSVVRAGVWAVPVISLATAAPALAVSGSPTSTGSLRFDTLNLFGADYDAKGKPTTLESMIQVQNVYTPNGPTLSTVNVLVTYSVSRVDGSAPVELSGSGWTYGSAVRDGGSWIYSFVWSGSLASSKSTPQLTYKVALKNSSSGNADITATASATGVQPTTAAASTNLG